MIFISISNDSKIPFYRAVTNKVCHFDRALSQVEGRMEKSVLKKGYGFLDSRWSFGMTYKNGAINRNSSVFFSVWSIIADTGQIVNAPMAILLERRKKNKNEVFAAGAAAGCAGICSDSCRYSLMLSSLTLSSITFSSLIFSYLTLGFHLESSGCSEKARPPKGKHL